MKKYTNKCYCVNDIEKKEFQDKRTGKKHVPKLKDGIEY